RPSPSRRNCTSRVRPSTSPDTALPFTVIVTFVISTSLWTSTGSAAEDALDPTLLLARLAVRGSGLLRRLPGRVSGNRGPFDRGLEALEKLVGELLGKAVDDPAAELGELAADMRLDLVAERSEERRGGKECRYRWMA